MDANAIAGIVFLIIIVALVVFARKMKKRKRKRRAEDLSDVPRAVWKKKYKNSNHFRGYKKISLATYQERGCKEGLSRVNQNADGEIGEKEIELEYIKCDGWEAINVYVENNKIGAFYDRGDNKLFNAIIKENFDSVHVKIGEKTVISVSDETGKAEEERRPRPFLFIHLK